jgi:hypothetical protein
MYPEDRVLVAVITRRKDLRIARDQSWYRIPQARLKHGLDAEYLAFFVSSRLAPSGAGGIYFFAARAGLELAYRRDLLPDEADHPRAGEIYYQVQLRAWQDKIPPILNPNRRPVTFIQTTWDRFCDARSIDDLFSRAPHYTQRYSPQDNRPHRHTPHTILVNSDKLLDPPTG